MTKGQVIGQMNEQERILKTEYSEEMQKSFIDYAMSVIISRALPDVRDGLKPVQRRTLYDMHELGIRYDKPYRKSARIVGDTMGKYHPHGDSSIYEALVVMTQDFKKGMPLIDGHGNFGNIEGDGAAAMRYTEARLEQVTQEAFLSDLDKDVVDFIPNFDETENLYIEGDNVQDYCSRCAVLRDILICNEPVPISLVEGTLMYGILTTPFTVEQKTKKSGYSDLSFKIYTPYTYSNYLLPFSGSNNITVINSGQLPVKPFVSVTVGSNCHFVQLQNKLTGETVLVGKYPTLGIDTSAPARKLVYSNTCQSMLNINSGVSNIYSDRSTNGTLAVSSTGKGIILASLGSGDTAWKGAAGKINIGTNLDEFLISINLTHSSTGKNGDPNIFEAEKEYQGIQVVEGKKGEYYEFIVKS